MTCVYNEVGTLEILYTFLETIRDKQATHVQVNAFQRYIALPPFKDATTNYNTHLFQLLMRVNSPIILSCARLDQFNHRNGIQLSSQRAIEMKTYLVQHAVCVC